MTDKATVTRTSKHARAQRKPRGWHRRLRRDHKRQKLARRAHRGQR